jgi:hypothetical protein
MTMMAIDDARVRYTSSAIALGSAGNAAALLCIGGFYLVRGRIAEDLRSGIAGVVAASPVDNSLLLFCRWLGGAAYLSLLAVAFLATMLVFHLLRGEGALELGIYLQTYAMLLIPAIVLAASCAILFDAIAPLMGKAGDVIYFLLWTFGLALAMDYLSKDGRQTQMLLFDFSGLATAMWELKHYVPTDKVALGGADFNPALAPITLPALSWPVEAIWLRCVAAMVALLPLLPAFMFFHRYSPDRVKPARARKRRSPLELVNGWLRPFSSVVRPLFQFAASQRGMGGRVLADVALTFTAAPVAIVLILASALGAALIGKAELPGLLIAAVAAWGILACNVSTRDFESDCEAMTGATNGGTTQRYARHLAATIVLGLLFTGAVALRSVVSNPLLTLAVLSGVLSFSALASLLGRCSRSTRPFLALFLFWLYVATNARTVPIIDVFGFNGVATAETISIQLLVALLAGMAGFFYHWRATRQ